jgi:hypothetical protein
LLTYPSTVLLMEQIRKGSAITLEVGAGFANTPTVGVATVRSPVRVSVGFSLCQLDVASPWESPRLYALMATLARYFVHSTVVPAIVSKLFFAPSEGEDIINVNVKELLLSNGGGCYGKTGKRGTR